LSPEADERSLRNPFVLKARKMIGSLIGFVDEERRTAMQALFH
jgi:hypothetical protein